MYITVVLKLLEAVEDIQQGITERDIDMYYEVWENFDETATVYIPRERLGEFVDKLKDPLRIALPNHFKIVSMNITVCEGDKAHLLDVLDKLVKNFLGATDVDDLGCMLKRSVDKDGYKPVSSTLGHQRIVYSAKIAQRAWRGYKAGALEQKKKKGDESCHIPSDIKMIDYESEKTSPVKT